MSLGKKRERGDTAKQYAMGQTDRLPEARAFRNCRGALGVRSPLTPTCRFGICSLILTQLLLRDLTFSQSRNQLDLQPTTKGSSWERFLSGPQFHTAECSGCFSQGRKEIIKLYDWLIKITQKARLGSVTARDDSWATLGHWCQALEA